MTEKKEADFITDSILAFINQQYETALRLAKKAIKLEPKNPEAYKCAGNANISLQRYDDAVKSYRQAVKYDPNNGNRYFDLGFALVSAEKTADAMRNLAKADELGCTQENLAQLYNLLGIICFDIGRYDDAIINLNKAEKIIGINMDILQRKIIIYGLKEDIRNGLIAVNQLKLVAPSDYLGYKYAFNLLIQSDRLEDAAKELEKAQQYANLTMDYYFDKMTLELEYYKKDGDTKHLKGALAIIENALKMINPTVSEVVDCYINAAELYLQLEDADRTLDCLNAAQNPAASYNNGFEIIINITEPVSLSEYDIEDMIEIDRQQIVEDLGEYGLDELVESIAPDEEGNREYFTEVDEVMESNEEVYKLDEAEDFELSIENIDQLNRLYIGAYTLRKDYEKVIEYALVLQGSESIHSVYIGKYTEANAMKEMGSLEAVPKYETVIKFFRNAMIKDPTDIMAVTFRTQCYIDIENFIEAEEMCNLLNEEIRKPFLEQIENAKLGGDLN